MVFGIALEEFPEWNEKARTEILERCARGRLGKEGAQHLIAISRRDDLAILQEANLVSALAQRGSRRRWRASLRWPSWLRRARGPAAEAVLGSLDETLNVAAVQNDDAGRDCDGDQRISRCASGVSPNITPAAVATPFPPLKPTKTVLRGAIRHGAT